jgi:hypothetical protein
MEKYFMTTDPLDEFAMAAITGVIGSKEVWSGNRGTDTKSMMASQGFNGSNSITPERAAFWAYEIAREMVLKSKEIKSS